MICVLLPNGQLHEGQLLTPCNYLIHKKLAHSTLTEHRTWYVVQVKKRVGQWAAHPMTDALFWYKE